MAAMHGHAVVIGLLLEEARVDPSALDAEGRTALHRAATVRERVATEAAELKLVLDGGQADCDASAQHLRVLGTQVDKLEARLKTMRKQTREEQEACRLFKLQLREAHARRNFCVEQYATEEQELGALVESTTNDGVHRLSLLCCCLPFLCIPLPVYCLSLTFHCMWCTC